MHQKKLKAETDQLLATLAVASAAANSAAKTADVADIVVDSSNTIGDGTSGGEHTDNNANTIADSAENRVEQLTIITSDIAGVDVSQPTIPKKDDKHDKHRRSRRGKRKKKEEDGQTSDQELHLPTIDGPSAAAVRETGIVSDNKDGTDKDNKSLFSLPFIFKTKR
jgi:hypothetical protein